MSDYGFQRMSIRQLQDEWSVQFRFHPHLDAVDIRIPGWTRCRDYETLRCSLINGGEQISVARPGLGGTFKLSYRYVLTFPAQNCGFAGIRKRMKEQRGGWGDQLYRNEIYADLHVAALNAARKLLLRNYRKYRHYR